MKKIKLSIFITFLITLSCTNNDQEVSTANAGMPSSNPVLSEEQMALADIQIGKLEERSIKSTLLGTGVIDLPPQSILHIHSRHGGYIGKVPQIKGDRVRKGQLLSTVQHPTIITKQRAYLKAELRMQNLEKDLKRQETLQAQDASSLRNLEKVKTEYQIALNEWQGIAAELKSIGIDASKLKTMDDLKASIPIYASGSGVIEEINIHPGELVTEDQLLYKILDLSHVHVEVNVLAKDIHLVRVGQTIEVQLPGQEETIMAEVYRMPPSIDLETKMAMVHAHLAEEVTQELLPGSFIQTKIILTDKQTLSLPNEAIQQEAGQSFVFVKIGDQLERRNVTSGVNNDRFTEIMNPESLEGLDIVIKGAYYVKAALAEE